LEYERQRAEEEARQKVEQEKRVQRALEELRQYEEQERLQKIKDEKERQILIERKQRLEKKEREYENKLRTMHGYLNKQGHVVKNWNVRYFAIKGTDVLYYIDGTLNKLKGKFSIFNATVEPTAVEGRENCFLIKAPNKSYILSAASIQEKQDWIAAISFIATGKIPLTEQETLKRTMSTIIKSNGNRLAHQGWLEKRGNSHRNWRKRWVVLSDAPGTKSLLYYESIVNGGSNLKGELSLIHASVERLNKKKHQNCFVVHTRTHEIQYQLKDKIFSAENEDDRTKWVNAINAAIQAIDLEEEKEKRIEESKLELKKKQELESQV